MNGSRIVLGGVVAGIVNFILDGVMHGVLLRPYWMEIAATLHLTSNADAPSQFGHYAVYDLAKGILAVLIYALARPRLGPGPKSAVLVGLITWALVLPVPLIGMLPNGFFSGTFATLWSVYGVVPVVAGTLAGCALYKEA
jgi:hypothetical protein